MSDVLRRRIAAALLLIGIAFERSRMTVDLVSVSGNRARIEGRYRAADGAAEPRTVLLVEQDGEWRVADPG